MSHGGLEIEHLVDVVPVRTGRPDELYTATDLKLDRRVAVRLLPVPTTPDDQGRFLDQARAIGGLSGHPNIVTVYDAGIAGDGRPYLVMELVDGPDLGHHLRTVGPLPWPDACDLALQLAGGLGQIHEAGHRYHHLRPEHVLLAGTTAKLGDIGLMAPADAEPTDPAGLVHQARETFRGEADERSDLYSLTSVLYQAIDGSAAYSRPDDSIQALRTRILGQSPPPLDPDLVPAALAVFVAAGLSPDPIDRPQTTGEFARELELIRQGRTTGSTPSLLHAPSGAVPVVLGAPLASTPAAPATVDPVFAPPSTGPTPVSALEATAALQTADVVSPLDPGQPAGPWPPPGLTPTGPEPMSMPTDAPAVGFAAPSAGFDTPGPAGDPWTGPTTDQTMVADLPPLVVEVEPQAPPRQPRSPLLLGATVMVVVGLLGLAGVLALSLRDTTTTDGSAAPLLPDPNAATETVDGLDPGSPTSLTPLAMIEESTTTTLSDEMVTSTDTTVVRAVVPSVVDLDVAGAGQLLSDAGFEVLVVGRVSPGSLPGTVIQQTPAAGTSIELPATVTLFIPRSTILPFMVGRPADTVCLQLTALDLQCEQLLRFDDRVPAGAVIATDPVEGASFTEGQTIRLTVSRGPLVEAAVPQVAGLDENEARTMLGQAGFTAVTVRSEPSESVPAGQAIATEPTAGTQLAIDQPVVIVLSSGAAPRVTVPELVGLERAAAEAALAAAQLTATFVGMDLPAGDPGIGRVVAVNPAVGTEVLAGSAVTVRIGQEAPGSGSTTTTTAMMTTTTAASSTTAASGDN